MSFNLVCSIGLALLHRKNYAATETAIMNQQTTQLLGEEAGFPRECS